MQMAGGGAVGDQRDRQVGGVGRVILDLYIEHGGEPAQALRADAERVDLFKKFDAQFFGAIGRAARDQLMDVDFFHQRFFGQQHGFFSGAANADAEHAGRTPTRAHGRHGFQYPVDDRVGRVEHGKFTLGFGTAALGRDVDFHRIAGNQLVMDHRRGVVAGVLARASRISQHGCAQFVIGVVVSAAHAFVDHVGDRHGAIPAHVHTDANKNRDNASILTDRSMAFGAHAAIGQ